jgi:hypothetical protein
MAYAFTFSRRRLLMLAAGAATQSRLSLYGGNSDFWNKKDPSEWSSEEIDKLSSRSPWARQVGISEPYSRINNGGGGPVNTGDPGTGGTGPVGFPGGGGGYPGGGYPGRGMGYPGGGMGGGRRGSPGGPSGTRYTATVRWESAKPIQEALKTPLPEDLAHDYVISVSGVPVLESGRQRTDDGESETTISKGLNDEVLDRIKGLTYLEPKGKSPIQPTAVVKGPPASSGMPTVLFGFHRDLLPLTTEDKEVTFTTQLGRLEVKTRFNLKDMMYHNELAL